MGVGEDHLELVSDADSSEHVADCAFNSAQYCVSLLLLKPHTELEGVGSLLIGFSSDLDWDVLESFD